MIEYLVGGAVLAFIIYWISTRERRRRPLPGTGSSSSAALEAYGVDLTPPLDIDADASTHHQPHDYDHGGHDGGHHGGDFDFGGGHHH